MWTIAGPKTATIFLPAARFSRMRRATRATTSRLGFSEETAEPMNSKAREAWSWPSGTTRMPRLPTTRRSPARTWIRGIVRATPASGSTRMPQSISGQSTGIQRPSKRMNVSRLVVE